MYILVLAELGPRLSLLLSGHSGCVIGRGRLLNGCHHRCIAPLDNLNMEKGETCWGIKYTGEQLG